MWPRLNAVTYYPDFSIRRKVRFWRLRFWGQKSPSEIQEHSSEAAEYFVNAGYKLQRRRLQLIHEHLGTKCDPENNIFQHAALLERALALSDHENHVK